MALALTDTVPLLAWATLLVGLVLAVAAKSILTPIFDAINSAIGWVPFAGDWVKHATEHVLSELDSLIVRTRDAMSWLWHLFLWSVSETVTVTEEAFGFAEGSLVNLVAHAIPGAFVNLWADVNNLVSAVLGELHRLENTVAGNLKTAEHYADRAAAGAVKTAENYADAAVGTATNYLEGRLHDVKQAVEADIAAGVTHAIAVAEGYADQLRQAVEAELARAIAGVESDLGKAVSTLNSAIASTATRLETELSSAEQALTSRIAATAAELEAQLATAEKTLNAAIAAAEAQASTELAAAAGELTAAIAGVRSEVHAIAGELGAAAAAAAGEVAAIPGLAYDDIRTLVDRLDLSRILGWGAAIVLLRALVESLAAEAGLGSAQCRSMVKGICGLNPNGWESLLGLAADFLFLTDPCAVIPLLEDAANVVGGPLVEGLTYVDAGLCSASSSAPPALPIPPLELPPPAELAELAA